MDIGIVLIILLVIIVGLGFYGVGAYNALVRNRNQIEEAWRQIDVELNRRYDLIPNLVNTVKGYAAHEKGTLENVIKLRNQAQQMSGSASPTADRAQVEDQLSAAVSRLLVTVEAYPDLKANTNFLELQRQLADTEDRIANGRKYYNALVSNYNTRTESFPTSFLANMFGFKRATYFEVNDAAVRQAPAVSFDEAPAAPAAPPVAFGADPALPQGSQAGAYESPNYSVRSGVQDANPAVANPAQSGGGQFGYQPPQQAPVPEPGAPDPEGYRPPATS